MQRAVTFLSAHCLVKGNAMHNTSEKCLILYCTLQIDKILEIYVTHFAISEDEKRQYLRNLSLVIHLGEMSNLL